MRPITDVTIEELEEIVKNNACAPDVDFSTLVDRADFELLFKHRLNPRFIAQKLLKERRVQEPVVKDYKYQTTYVPSEPLEEKIKRRELKEKELEIKELRAQTDSRFQNEVKRRLAKIEELIVELTKAVSEPSSHKLG